MPIVYNLRDVHRISSVAYYHTMETENLEDQFCKMTVKRLIEPIDESGANNDYSDLEHRQTSFVSCHAIDKTLKALLAQAGFYYIGPDDSVQCYQCSGKLNQWTHYDTPILEHAFYFPHCDFIKSIVGPELIKHIRNVHSKDLISETCKKNYVYKKWYSPFRLCDSCCVNKANVALYPCGHAHFCVQCVGNDEKCKLCKTNIVLVMKLKL